MIFIQVLQIYHIPSRYVNIIFANHYTFFAKFFLVYLILQLLYNMQALYLKKNTRSHESSFKMNHAIVPHMYDQWHYHQELEINLILKGSGTRFVGDNIQSFNDEDLVLVGANLPHVWKNDPIYYEGLPDLYADVINIHFLTDFAGKDFFLMPEMQAVKDLLETSKRGIRFNGECKKRIKEKMIAMQTMPDGDKLLTLFQILNLMAHSNDIEKLSTAGFTNAYKDSNLEKINRIYDYIINNFSQEISLAQVAALAHMNEAAFCRYFKNATKKTFTHFVNETRIGYACKLLIDGNLNVSQICYESGFNNISNFNRQFKRITGKTPQMYQVEYKKI